MMLSLVISTHALREEGDVEGLMLSPDCEISTHALREEGDRGQSRWLYPLVQFLPTPSARRATLKRRLAAVPKVISTHALREEGDQLAPQQRRVESQISTHALREEGDPARSKAAARTRISTHALREEGDIRTTANINTENIFLPTPSARRATEGKAVGFTHWFNFYPRPPRGGRLHANLAQGRAGLISTHALREEGDSCRSA